MGAANDVGSGPVVTTARGPAEGEPQELEREVVMLRHRLAVLEHGQPRRHRVRQSLMVFFAVLTVVAVVATTGAVWLRRTALETDRFMALVEPVLGSPELADALSVRLTDEALEALALEQRLTARLSEGGVALRAVVADSLELEPGQQARIEALPLPQLTDLAAPIASGLEARISTRLDQFVRSPEFQRLLVEGTEVAHTKAVALLRGDYEELPNVEVEAGEVRLNLVPVVAGALEDLTDQGLGAIGVDEIPFIDPFADPDVALERLSSALDTELPPDFGQVTVMSEAELEELQAAARLADRLVLVLAIISVALLALTITLAPRRRRALLQVSLGTVAGLVITMLLLRSTEDEIAGTAQTPQGQEALRLLTDATFDSLRTTMIVVLGFALVVAVVTYLLGRPPWLTRAVGEVRRATAAKPGGSDLGRALVQYKDALRIAVLAVAVGLLFVFGLSLWTILVIPTLALLALWGLNVAQARAPAAVPEERSPAEELDQSAAADPDQRRVRGEVGAGSGP